MVDSMELAQCAECKIIIGSVVKVVGDVVDIQACCEGKKNYPCTCSGCKIVDDGVVQTRVEKVILCKLTPPKKKETKYEQDELSKVKYALLVVNDRLNELCTRLLENPGEKRKDPPSSKMGKVAKKPNRRRRPVVSDSDSTGGSDSDFESV
mmetsp:Transcript_3796/g.5512  ORF Transcript_3796/g.5512 Transcript_3796/m.5512 type:complete len:151 (-) Transcript_3796:77-529(-)|eukprot:CAMPEP_0203792842 /NCGR_PEP_ID=MMETSP0100_2-20121128/5500_1 /ASSEMBLY_ACC=CAM_ASM_000210 /TAXON_ID=96639 /ORGANISM=" , Strain NY0313808BC1" /LENGTH=150 /DNA_ID=CAMNT_0050696487 /DNA_START=309 /DNA_END=761 /DNA_ORIENTATION=+